MTTVKTETPLKLILFAIAGVWAYGWLPNLLLMLESGRVVDETLSGASGSTSLSHSASATLGFLTVAVLLAALVQSSKNSVINGWYPLILIAPWAVLYLGDIVFRDNGFSFREVAYPLLVLAVYHVRPYASTMCLFLARLAVISACIALAMSITMRAVAFMPLLWNSDNEKAIIGTLILAGPYAHSNQIGTALALALPLIYASYSGLRRNVYMALALVAVLWSASRASIISLLVFVTILLIFVIVRSLKAQMRFLQVAIALAVIVSVALPLVTDDPLAFTRRGLIWQESLRYWSLSPLTGWGPNILNDKNALTWAIGAYPHTSHNIWVTFATMGGVLALVAVAALFLLIVRRASRMYVKGARGPLLFVLLFALIEIAEDPVRALGLGPQSFIVWGGLILVMCKVPVDEVPEQASIDAEAPRKVLSASS
jgi:O-antigen ligase